MDCPTASHASTAPHRAAHPLPGLVGAVLFVGLALLTAGCEGAGSSAVAEGGLVAAPLMLDGAAFEAAGSFALPALAATELPGLHNLFRLSDQVISGSEPENEAAFAELAGLGVKTILSVDGKQPASETAARYGLAYVHVPIQYSGIDGDELAAITKTFREQQGPFYVHCFHGRHRGPAAAAIGRLVVDGVGREEALAEMRQWCGTSSDYAGLYATVASAQIPDAATTAALDFDFAAGHAFEGVRGVMIPMPRSFDALKAIQPLGWAINPSHPDLDAVHEAEILVELFGKLIKQPWNADQGYDDRTAMHLGEAAAQRLLAALAEGRQGLSPDQALEGQARQRADAALADISSACTSCHAQYRN